MNRLLMQVEETSGLPVMAVQQGDLEELATVQLATQEDQTHRILYREAGEASSYHVAFEAALLLRIVQVPAEQRVILHETRQAREKVVSSVERMFKGQISLAQARNAGVQYYDQLLLRLRSTGPGFWVDRWLVEQAPELRGFQAALLQVIEAQPYGDLALEHPLHRRDHLLPGLACLVKDHSLLGRHLHDAQQ
ncbi:MAG: hypothetical protein ACKOPS_27455, partial [Cyanobium sp.]